MLRAGLVAILFLSGFLLNGCGGGSGAKSPFVATLSVTASATVTAGTPFNITVSALDAANNVVTTYAGTVHFTSTDAQAILPTDSKLTNGVGNFSATLKTPGGRTITATDTVTTSITGTSASIAVTGPATHFSITTPQNVTTGVAFNFTVTALDATNNTVAGYGGTLHFTSTDPQATLPANAMLTNGTGAFSATLKTLGSQTIKATDTVTASITGTSNSINVVSTAATHFSVETFPTARAGTSFNFSVTARDAANNVATTYSGTVHFTSTDLKAVLPANSTLTNGTETFPATLNTKGVQTIIATDTVTTSITGTSNGITVFTGACQKFDQPCDPQTLPCCPGLVCFHKVTSFVCGPLEGPAELKTPSRFTAACTMEVPREFHSSTLLNIGLVLIAAGDNGSFSLATAELFNPETRTFAPAGDLASARALHSATSLPNGTVLITGGRDIRGNALASAEIFNTETMSFAPASSMTTARESHTTTLLRNGKVLLAGGNDGDTALASAELFDPQIGSFTPIASMNSPRSFHTATLLKDGRVLVVGGQDAKSTIFATAEIFDPATARFTPTGQMSTARELHTATLLEDGRVLIAGGDNENEALATAELFDPQTGKFSSTGSMEQSRESHTATLRDDGTVLVVGGNALISELDGGVHAGLVANSTVTAELFDPSNGSFHRVGEMSNPRANHTATLLPDGSVIVIGGAVSGNFSPAFFLSSAELFQ
jgi:hypothetical protein